MEPVFGKLGRHKTGEKPRVPGNISLLQLPSYSPGLNPVDPSTGEGERRPGIAYPWLIARTEENRNDQAEKARASVRRSGLRYRDYRRFGAEREAMGGASFFRGSGALCCPSCRAYRRTMAKPPTGAAVRETAS